MKFYFTHLKTNNNLILIACIAEFTIEVTNSTNGTFTAKENTFQRITATVKPVTSCKKWELTVSNKSVTVCSFSVNASDVCTAHSIRHNCTCGSRSAQGQELQLNMNVTRKDNDVTLRWIVKLANRTTFSKIRLNITCKCFNTYIKIIS